MIDVLLLILGLVLILAGASALTDGASAIARRFNISDMVIGLTIVAFGTSAPELVISSVSSIKGSAGLALGNVVGSNIFNILLIIGITAAVHPIRVDSRTISRDVPFVLLSSLVVCFVALDSVFDAGSENRITRADGLLLLAFFAIFMRYTISMAHNSSASESNATKSLKLSVAVLYTLGGLLGLIFGGQIFVDGASGVARMLGVSEAIIGLTIVAGGTSLPELATSVVAAVKNKPDMAVGNVVGSCIFNAFLILGVSATIAPMGVEGFNISDFGVLVGASVLFWIVSYLYKKRTITRIEGILLALGYVAYMVQMVTGS